MLLLFRENSSSIANTDGLDGREPHLRAPSKLPRASTVAGGGKAKGPIRGKEAAGKTLPETYTLKPRMRKDKPHGSCALASPLDIECDITCLFQGIRRRNKDE